MKKNSLTLSLPEWIDDFQKQYQFPLVSNEAVSYTHLTLPTILLV